MNETQKHPSLSMTSNKKNSIFLSILGFLVLVLTFVFFLRAATSGHLSLDDWGYTAGCPFVKDGLSLKNISRAFTTLGHGGIWMPFTYITYMSDITFWGGGWKVHHIINILLHAITAVAIFAFIFIIAKISMSQSDKKTALCSALAVLLWALHPSRAEAVAWIASRKEILWSFFALLSAISWINFLRSHKNCHYIATILTFVLSCLSKPTAVIFPVLALILHKTLFTHERVSIRRYAPMFTISFFVGIIAIHSQSNPTGLDQINLSDTTFTWRALNAAVSIGLYVYNTFMPTSVHMDYRSVFGGMPLRTPLGISIFTLLVISIITILLFKFSRKFKLTSLFIFSWFFASLLPVLGLLGVTGDKAFADRYTYLPTVAIALGIALLILKFNKPKFFFALCAISACTAIAEAQLAVPVIDSFRNDLTAYTRVTMFDKNHWRAMRMLARQYAARGQTDEAINMLERSLILRPSRITADNLAYLLALRGNKGDFEKVRHLGSAAIANPKSDFYGMMLDALGIVSMREGNDKNAIVYFRASLAAPERSYTNVHTVLNLGLTLANCGQRFEAIETLAKLHKSSNSEVKKRAIDAIDAIRQKKRARFEWR